MGWTDPDTVQTFVTGDVITAALLEQLVTNDQWHADHDRARVYRSSTQSISTATQTAVQWNAEEWDTATLHDNSTNPSRLTAATAGLHRVTARVVFAAAASGIRQASLWANGVGTGTLLDTANDYSPGTGGTSRLLLTATVDLAAAEYVEAACYQNTGGNVNVAGAAIGTSERSWAELEWVGVSP